MNLGFNANALATPILLNLLKEIETEPFVMDLSTRPNLIPRRYDVKYNVSKILSRKIEDALASE
jgi:hypothetical protein